MLLISSTEECKYWLLNITALPATITIKNNFTHHKFVESWPPNPDTSSP